MSKAPRSATDSEHSFRPAESADDPAELEPKGTPTSDRYQSETIHADETPRAVQEKKRPAGTTHP